MDSGSQRTGNLRQAARSPIKAALALLVLYAVMHLAAGGVLLLFNATGTVARDVRDGAVATSVSIDSDAPYQTSYATEAKAKRERLAEDSRECRIGFPFDPNCSFE